MAIDTLRHYYVFDPEKFDKRRVDIIGCGASGSRTALAIAKLGITNIHIWDYDKVESHNLANQLFDVTDVGRLKTEAVADLVKRQTGTEVVVHSKKVEGHEQFGDVVFLLVDKMSVRKAIFQDSIRFRPTIGLMIETRMGIDNGRIYSVVPGMPEQVKEWEATLYSDEEMEVSPCGTPITVGATADVLAGLSIWSFITWFDHVLNNSKPAPEFEIIVGARPAQVFTRATV